MLVAVDLRRCARRWSTQAGARPIEGSSSISRCGDEARPRRWQPSAARPPKACRPAGRAARPGPETARGSRQSSCQSRRPVGRLRAHLEVLDHRQEAKTWRPSGTWAMPRWARSAGDTEQVRPLKSMRPHRCDNAGNRLEQRRLSGTIGADDGDELPGATSSVTSGAPSGRHRRRQAIRKLEHRSIHFLPR